MPKQLWPVQVESTPLGFLYMLCDGEAVWQKVPPGLIEQAIFP